MLRSFSVDSVAYSRQVKAGVQLDAVMLPTAADLAAGRDPALAHSAELASVNLDPVRAGRMFPDEWMPI